VGRNTGLYNGTFFDLGPHAEVSIGHYSTLVSAIVCTDGRVNIGSYVFIAHEVVIADAFCAVPFAPPDPVGTLREPTDGDATEIVIGENAWAGARAAILSGARIGEGSIVGAAAVVDFVVPPFTVVAGNPARVVRRLVPPEPGVDRT
jgi:acetyltransferase-like isoleucine patch superfamily enzyme